MTKILLFLYGCMAGEAALAQADSTEQAPTWLLTINPVALVDPFGPSSLRVGTEWLVSPRITLALEANAFYQYINVSGNDEHLQGAGMRFSTVYWTHRWAGDGAKGLSLDLGYKNTAGTVSDSIKIDSVAPYSKDYGIDRKVFTARLCMLEHWQWTDRFWVELYYGIGIRFEHSTSSGITQEELDARDFSAGPDNDNFIVPAMHGVGEFIQPDLVIGLRIGLALR